MITQAIFGKENYYLELMDHGISDQKRLNEKLLELSKKTGVPLVATNDCHYLKRKMRRLTTRSCAIGTGSTLAEPSRLRFEETEFYYKSPEEMYALFKHCPEAVRRTLEIAERCTVDIKLDQNASAALRSAFPTNGRRGILKRCVSMGCSAATERTRSSIWNACAMNFPSSVKMGFSNVFPHRLGFRACGPRTTASLSVRGEVPERGRSCLMLSASPTSAR